MDRVCYLWAQQRSLVGDPTLESSEPRHPPREQERQIPLHPPQASAQEVSRRQQSAGGLPGGKEGRGQGQHLDGAWLTKDSIPRCLCAKLLQSCLTLCDPMDCSLPGFSVHGSLPRYVGGKAFRGNFQN